MVASVCPYCGNHSPAVLKRVAKINRISLSQAIQTTPPPGQIRQGGAEAQAPASTAASDDDVANQLAKLAELRSSGALTDAEFSAAKARLLGG
jgi:hypothetical protein